MEWHDSGIVLSLRPHGETSVIATLLTSRYGRHAGLVHGGRGRAMSGTLQVGNAVRAHWRARLPEHLGSFVIESERAVASALFPDPLRLACLASACALCETALAERHPYRALYDATVALGDLLVEGSSHWEAAYVRWELGLLDILGYGLDIGRCAVTGVGGDLAWVSPRTGRAVSARAGEPWKERLLVLPGFLAGAPRAGPDDIRAGLKLTGHFLERHLLNPGGAEMPAARERLVDMLFRRAAT